VIDICLRLLMECVIAACTRSSPVSICNDTCSRHIQKPFLYFLFSFLHVIDLLLLKILSIFLLIFIQYPLSSHINMMRFSLLLLLLYSIWLWCITIETIYIIFTYLNKVLSLIKYTELAHLCCIL